MLARGDSEAASEAERAAAAYESLLARRSEAYADHAATFFMGPDNRPQRYWALHGLDQLLHRLTYIAMIYLVVRALGLA